MNNIISIAIIILVLINIYGNSKQKKTHKSNRVNKTNKSIKSIKSIKSNKTIKSNKSDVNTQDLTKQEYIIKTVKNLTNQVSNVEPIHLISAYTVELNDETNYTNQFSSVPRKLQTIDTNEIKGRDFIKTNFVDTLDTTQIVSAPAPSAAINDIIGITNAPMYAPVESIDSSVDIFLINQINTTKNNSVSYLDQPIITMNNKANYIKNNTSIEQINLNKSVDNVVAFSFGEKPYLDA